VNTVFDWEPVETDESWSDVLLGAMSRVYVRTWHQSSGHVGPVARLGLCWAPQRGLHYSLKAGRYECVNEGLGNSIRE